MTSRTQEAGHNGMNQHTAVEAAPWLAVCSLFSRHRDSRFSQYCQPRRPLHTPDDGKGATNVCKYWKPEALKPNESGTRDFCHRSQNRSRRMNTASGQSYERKAWGWVKKKNMSWAGLLRCQRDKHIFAGAWTSVSWRRNSPGCPSDSPSLIPTLPSSSTSNSPDSHGHQYFAQIRKRYFLRGRHHPRTDHSYRYQWRVRRPLHRHPPQRRKSGLETFEVWARTTTKSKSTPLLQISPILTAFIRTS